LGIVSGYRITREDHSAHLESLAARKQQDTDLNPS